MQMIRKRSVRYTSKKSSFYRSRSRSKLNSSRLKKDDHNNSCSKRYMPKLKSCTKKTRARKYILDKTRRTTDKDPIRIWASLKFAGEGSSNFGKRRNVIDADSDSRMVRKGKRRRKQKKKANMLDEASRLKRRTRYLLIRIKLEQNLIDAYSTEGWKGQSREKIKPEKELQRARRQILNCKLGIRDAIHQLELLSSEGCIEESVIYPDGSVHHEHIFCAKCKSREAFPDNDILLCDGTCNCGFHQKCLDPPLAKIPPGDQGWLCKFCESKMEILEVVNAHLGTCFSFNSGWEDIFKEIATGLDGGSSYVDPALEWPSEDSKDDDYDPDVNEKSNSMTSIEDSIPDDASSFSSLCCCSDEASSGSIRLLNDDRESKSYRRQRRDVDYKKLYDEMFGKDQNENEQSEDEDWGPRRRKQRRLECNDGINMDSCGDADQRTEMLFTRITEKKLPSISQERKPLFRIPHHAVEKLRQVFAQNELPSRAVKEDLSKQLGLASEKVSKWFKNARYAALRIRKAEGTEFLKDYINSSTNIRENQSSSAAILKGRSYLLTSSAKIHVPRYLRENLGRKNCKSIMPPWRKKQKRAASTLPTDPTKVSKCSTNATFSNKQTRALNAATFKKITGKGCPSRHEIGKKDNEDIYLNEMESLCSLYEKITKLKATLRACEEGHMSNKPQSTEQLVIYVPVAELKEKARGHTDHWFHHKQGMQVKSGKLVSI